MADEKKTGLAKIAPRTFSLLPTSLGEAMEIAKLIADSEFAPKDYKGKPANVMISIQMGADLGLKPMQSLQNLAVINGRPALYGDAALALVMPVLDRFFETFEGAEGSDAWMAVCIAKRKGWPDETRRTFSVADAKRANLWGKSGPWTNYPKRMMQFRARGFALRDVGADLLLGLVLAEEAMDYPSPDAIDGTVVSSEVVKDPLEGVEDGVREAIEKGMETCHLASGKRVQLLTEFLSDPKRTKSEGAQALLDWLKDEYAKQKTGQPRAKVENGKKPAQVVDAEPVIQVEKPVVTAPAQPVVDGELGF